MDQYSSGAAKGNGMTCDVPMASIMAGCSGGATSDDISTIASAVVSQDLLGIMIWYASVVNGFVYDEPSDASQHSDSVAAFALMFNPFN